MKGLFITFEGTEGSGKSTHIDSTQPVETVTAAIWRRVEPLLEQTGADHDRLTSR